MIELRMNLVDLSRIKHETLHSIEMIQRFKKAGVPVNGILLMRGIERGTLTWHTEEDLDGDICVVRWFDTNEPVNEPGTKWVKVSHVSHDGYTVTKWRDPSTPEEDDEL